jgi:transposase
VHLRVDGNGHLMTLALTPGHRHEATMFETLMEQGAIKRPQGRPKLHPRRVVGDKGYTGHKIRTYTRRHGMCLTIPRQKTERRSGPFDHKIYRLRNIVERMINRMKQFRRLATRYEKRSENYRAMWIIAATLLWLDFANTP